MDFLCVKSAVFLAATLAADAVHSQLTRTCGAMRPDGMRPTFYFGYRMFAQERTLFMCERFNGFYRVGIYTLSNILFDIIPPRAVPAAAVRLQR